MGNKHRFDIMKDFFEGVGTGHAAGIWEEVPQDRPEFRKKYAGMLAAKAKAEEAIGT
jgi:chlorophyllide a reductase subunit Y